MDTIVNRHQAEAWNGYEGRHWAAHQDRYDAINSGFNDALLAAVRPGDRVLDIGCGNGQLTRLAAARIGTAGRDATDAAGFLADWGPLRHQLDRVDPATADRARAALTDALRAYEQPDAVRLCGTAWLVTAHRPG